MRVIISVARREIAEKRVVFAAAAAGAVLPFVIPLVSGLSGTVGQEARGLASLLVAAALSLVLGIALGASLFPTGASGPRLGFYLSRPISGGALWTGKMAGAASLLVGSVALVILPTALAGGTGYESWELLVAGIALVALALATIAALHVVITALCSRSLLLAADVAVLAAAGVVLWIIDIHIFGPHATEAMVRSNLAFFIAVAAAFLAASLAIVVHGRTDLRLAHRAGFLALAVVLGIGLAGVLGFAQWLVSCPPGKLAVYFAMPAPAGSWVYVEGQGRGSYSSVLYDPESGRSRRMAWQTPSFSRSGTLAGWFPMDSEGGRGEMLTLRLGEDGAEPRATGIRCLGEECDAWAWTFSADGRRVAHLGLRSISVHDVEEGRLLLESSLAEESITHGGLFVGDDRLRLYRTMGDGPGSRRLEIVEYQLPSGDRMVTGTIGGFENGKLAIAVGPAGGRIIVMDRQAAQFRLHDGCSGEFLATLIESRAVQARSIGYLAGGRIVVGEASLAQPANLHVFSPEGAPERSIELPLARMLHERRAEPAATAVAA